MRKQINQKMHYVVEGTISQLNRGKIFDPRAKRNIKGKERDRIYGKLYWDVNK